MPRQISLCKQWEYNTALWVWWQTSLFYTKHCATCTDVCDSSRWQPKQNTAQCPEWFTWCNGVLGPPATSQGEHLPCAWDWTANLIPSHRAWGAGVLLPHQQSSCEQRQLPSSLLPEQRTHTMNVEETNQQQQPQNSSCVNQKLPAV